MLLGVLRTGGLRKNLLGREQFRSWCFDGVCKASARAAFCVQIGNWIRLARRNYAPQLSASFSNKIALCILVFYKPHDISSRSVAYLNVARLKRSQECRRREANIVLLCQAYALINLRAGIGARMLRYAPK